MQDRKRYFDGKIFPIVVHMGFEVAPDPSRKSGFGFALRDVKGRGDLLGDLRIESAARLVLGGFAHKIVSTGMVQRQEPFLNSASVIRDMLVGDYTVPLHAVEAIEADGQTTVGGANQAREYMNVNRVNQYTCAGVTNFFHGMRTREFFDRAGLSGTKVLVAEAVLIALTPQGTERDAMAAHVERRMDECGQGPLCFGEVMGIAATYDGTYASR